MRKFGKPYLRELLAFFQCFDLGGESLFLGRGRGRLLGSAQCNEPHPQPFDIAREIGRLSEQAGGFVGPAAQLARESRLRFRNTGAYQYLGCLEKLFSRAFVPGQQPEIGCQLIGHAGNRAALAQRTFHDFSI